MHILLVSIVGFIVFLLHLTVEAKLQPKDRTIIKSPLPIPKVGVVSSNPERTKLIAEQWFDYYYIHTNFRGYTVYVGEYKKTPMFASYLGLGSASATFMGEELISAGAETIIRLGTNDFNMTATDVNKVFVVDQCYGLAGVMQDMGFANSSFGSPFPSDPALVDLLLATGREFPDLEVQRASGYNIDAFYAFLDPTNVAVHSDGIRSLERKYSELGCKVRDMETCAVLLLGNVRKIRTASVLQAVVKHDPTKHEDTGTKGIPVVLETLRKQHRILMKERFDAMNDSNETPDA